MEYILTALIGLISGAIGSLIAPWIHWSIEKRKIKYQKKEELIEFMKDAVLKNDPREVKFLNSKEYIKIRPYLRDEFVKKLENKSVTEFTTNQYRSPYERQFLEEIDRIEIEWGLALSNKKLRNRKFEKTNSGESLNFIVSEEKDKTS